MLDKPRGGECGTLEIPTCDPGATNVDFAYDSLGHRASLAVKKVEFKVRYRHPNDAPRAGVEVSFANGPIRDVYGCLGDAIHINKQWLCVTVSVNPSP